MKISYDSDADAMYIRFSDEDIDHSKKMDDFTILDVNKKGEVIGLEILSVKERNPKMLDLQVKNMACAQL
ncbi:MAG: DUF2283 domain-containing protein [Nanoarchaeota archaeon]|nr:DUF2283 domain-containing protein [Nanoarchaeota archaeon]